MVTRALLWAYRLAVPGLTILLMALYAAVRLGKVSLPIVLLAGGSALVAFLAGYPIAAYLYDSSYAQQMEKYHPYLQIRPHSPPALDEREKIFLIMCLGGSTTEFKDDSGNGWPERLQRLLPAEIRGRRTVVMNMGRQWYTTQHTLMNYQLNLRHLRPDMIILMQSVNDMLVNADFSYISHGEFRPDYGHFYGPVNRLIDRKGLIEFFVDLTAGLWNYERREEVTTTEFPGLASFERNVRTLIDLTALDGTSLVLMSEPHLFREGLSDAERKSLHLLNYQSVGPKKLWTVQTAQAGMDAYNGKLQQLAMEHGLVFLDLDKDIPKTFEHFYDEVHYRPGSFDLVASSVAKRLLAAGDILFASRQGS
jgi:lysophospholipase L1-like esterase